jgi:hypothetical protein
MTPRDLILSYLSVYPFNHDACYRDQTTPLWAGDDATGDPANGLSPLAGTHETVPCEPIHCGGSNPFVCEEVL